MTVNLNASLTQGFGITSDTSGVLTFQSNAAETMRIDTSGNVGIGTTSPANKFQVAGTGDAHGTFGSTYPVTIYTNTSTVDPAIYRKSGSALRVGVTTDGIGAAGFSEQMRIDSSGNLGIGLAPNVATKLQVAAATNITLGIANATTVAGAITLEAINNARSVNIPMELRATNFAFTGPTTSVSIDTSGSLLIAGSAKTSAEKLNITHDGNANEGMIIVNTYTPAGTNTAIGFRRPSATTVGTITTTTSSTAYNTSSDYRLKHDVKPMTTGLDTILALKPVTYKWKIDDSIGEGFIAHELAENIPLAVVGEKDAINEDGSINAQGVDYSKIVVHLVAAIQELKAELDALKAKVGA